MTNDEARERATRCLTLWLDRTDTRFDLASQVLAHEFVRVAQEAEWQKEVLIKKEEYLKWLWHLAQDAVKSCALLEGKLALLTRSLEPKTQPILNATSASTPGPKSTIKD